MFRTVGERPSIKPPARRTPGARPQAALGIDVLLLLATITLAIVGLLMVYSASWDDSIEIYGSPGVIFSRQVIWLVLGTIVAIVLALVDYHHWTKLAVPAIGVTVVALIAVLLISETRNGAVRTLWSGSVQPSEAAKLVTIIYLSVWLFAKREKLSDVTFGLIPLAAILGLMGGLILLQPDLSAVATIFILGGILFFLAGADLRQIGFLVLVAAVIGVAIATLTPTGSERVRDYFSGLRDPTQASYHVLRAIESFVKGSWFGVGIGKAETKLTGLPFPFTDSIFAVVGEETGVLGASALVGLYVLLLWRGMTVARQSPDELGSLLAAGLTLWITLEAFINMSNMVNLLPFAGNALPFMSSGGSNLVVTLAAMGILINISRQGVRVQEEGRRKFREVINLRRGNRRGRVSRTGRSTGAR
ncbi:MAG TPA: putative peptidoglycan glycosyltransferase FtsW [Anaerolineales bacterium]|nr:putative peptidoglycan glycosyltransferase FtsW [Anaerolineales bacterium]